ncbi:MAG: DNA polymerase/3'-5' exonuclease PolX [Gemmatimonadota bacterium]|nr:DNA polymerase/3'-5' exonuclease PolX [Gemmatimonadota bacterium]
MNKQDVVRALEQIAAFLELKGEDQTRVRSYQSAARVVLQYSDDLAEAVDSGRFAETAGVSPPALAAIEDVVKTGKSKFLLDLRSEIPAGLAAMLHIPGLGVQKVRQIHEQLGIDTLTELEAAARDGRLASLPRFGNKAAEKVIKSLQLLRHSSNLRLFHHARDEAESLVPGLNKLPGVIGVHITGGVRRRSELIGDLRFVMEFNGSWEELQARLTEIPDVTEFASKTEGSFTIKFRSGSVAELYVSGPESLGFKLIQTTGSEAHLEQLAEHAKNNGLEWTDGGVIQEGGEVAEARTEEDLYNTIGLQWIPPEIREGTGEIQAASEGAIPNLVTEEDIRGFLHCHSNYSDGTSTVKDWAVAAKELGYQYVGITDHSVAALYAGGLVPDAIEKQHSEIDAVNEEFEDVRILKGIEVDILENGALDYSPEIREQFDFVIASVHNRFNQDQEAMTARILRAMDDPTMTILGHPTGRLLLSREPYAMDLDRIFEKAAANNIAVEINADPQRLDLDWRFIRNAVSYGVTISIGADAHSTSGMSNMELGVGIARKGWLTPDQVLNTLSLEDFLSRIATRRSN